MRVLITGVCGFVGNALAQCLVASLPDVKIIGIDNLVRAGSERNAQRLERLGGTFYRGDLRCRSDLESLPPADWVIDAAALPSVIAGVDGRTSGRQVVEHNLIGTLNLAEYCREHRSGCVLLSTSRVYSIAALSAVPLVVRQDAFTPDEMKLASSGLPGLSSAGIGENFSTASPVSIYGATKLASETMMLEYGAAYDFPVWVNRCGVLAGAGQFARADQGIFSFWIDSHRQRKPLKYIGFDGSGYQVRDCLHPDDLGRLIVKQMAVRDAPDSGRIFNIGGGQESAMSLKQLTHWCDRRFGKHPVESSDEVRPFDLPWIVINSERTRRVWDWRPERTMDSILEEIAQYGIESREESESPN